MLNEREMAMAKELARELTEADRATSQDEAEQIVITVKQVIEYVVETVTNIWNQLKDMLSNMTEHIYESERTIKEHNFKSRKLSWHVPIKVRIPEAPFVKSHNLRFARSNL